MTPLLSIQALSAHYQKSLVLKDINFDLPTASIMGIVGSSGSGKTTLARVITGEMPYSSGRVVWGGKVLNPSRDREQRRQIQMIYQDPFVSLNPRITVGKILEELLIFVRGVKKNDVKQEVGKLLNLVHLGHDFIPALPEQLSGGQRQRVAIARALAVNPLLLIADEPTSSLDVSIRTSILDLFKELRDTLGLTILFISHDLLAVRYVCNEIIVMDKGESVERNTAEQIFTNPISLESKRLISCIPRLNLNSAN
ncbi:ATP-binding cassette domain-containing protein [Klebsiella variicola]|uniref:ATP-binding cassette domain-containing protein n=1 Tax=Klebsiella pneumoniae TaxID=573 RepID=A0A9J6S6L0_KLEPN|nr:ATP-binding cassette domain-containing protein [Klebsiella pneumoniae]HCT5785451.1 ABC transporter ATP-binding protein [Klebsiella variicola]